MCLVDGSDVGVVNGATVQASAFTLLSVFVGTVVLR